MYYIRIKFHIKIKIKTIIIVRTTTTPTIIIIITKIRKWSTKKCGNTKNDNRILPVVPLAPPIPSCL